MTRIEFSWKDYPEVEWSVLQLRADGNSYEDIRLSLNGLFTREFKNVTLTRAMIRSRVSTFLNKEEKYRTKRFKGNIQEEKIKEMYEVLKRMRDASKKEVQPSIEKIEVVPKKTSKKKAVKVKKKEKLQAKKILKKATAEDVKKSFQKKEEKAERDVVLKVNKVDEDLKIEIVIKDGKGININSILKGLISNE